MAVGVKELKNSLSRYLDAVRAGETVLVTERGRVVAELRPRAQAVAGSEEEALAALEREGGLSRGRGKIALAPLVRLKGKAKASLTVLSGRDDALNAAAAAEGLRVLQPA